MKSKACILFIFSLFSITMVFGQRFDITHRLSMHIEDIIFHVDAPSEEIPYIIIDSNGTTVYADATASFVFLNYIDSTREIIISDLTVNVVLLRDSVSGDFLFGDFIYSEVSKVPPPEGMDNYKRNTLFNKIEELFNNERKEWFVTLPINVPIENITECADCMCRCTLRCWIKF